MALSKSMPKGQFRRQKMEWEKYKNCVYTNPNYDYKKSQYMYNKKYSRPGFVECNENTTGVQASFQNVRKSAGNDQYAKIKLLSSISNPKIRQHRLFSNLGVANKKSYCGSKNRSR